MTDERILWRVIEPFFHHEMNQYGDIRRHDTGEIIPIYTSKAGYRMVWIRHPMYGPIGRGYNKLRRQVWPDRTFE